MLSCHVHNLFGTENQRIGSLKQSPLDQKNQSLRVSENITWAWNAGSVYSDKFAPDLVARYQLAFMELVL